MTDISRENEEPTRCAECDCKYGGIYCNWIASPARVYIEELTRVRTALDAAKTKRDAARELHEEGISYWKCELRKANAERDALAEKLAQAVETTLGIVLDEVGYALEDLGEAAQMKIAALTGDKTDG